METNYQKQMAEYNRAIEGNLNVWVAACGGTEPIMQDGSGRHFQYVYNPALGEHGYYCFETDLVDIDLPDWLTK